MKITHALDHDQQRMEICVAGDISAEGACGIIQHTIVETYGGSYREVTLDLRQAFFDKTISLFRLHSLLQVFKIVILQKNIKVTIIFNTENADRLVCLSKATDFAGINIRSFITHAAAFGFLGASDQQSSSVP